MILKFIVLLIMVIGGYLIATNDTPYDGNDDSWI